jgi:hypothetical protein
MDSGVSTAIERDGYAIVSRVLNAEARAALAAALGPAAEAGRRGLLREPAVHKLAQSEILLGLIRPILGPSCQPVRAIYFNKTAETNWLVPWHQDLTLALRAWVEAPGFGPWSVKENIPHVQAPAEYLEKMLTVRLHLDDTDDTNGALRVLPGTHRLGKLNAEQIARLRPECGEVRCDLRSGDAMLMRPLLLHASSRSSSARQRRVLHIEYAGFQLPGGMQWHEHG